MDTIDVNKIPQQFERCVWPFLMLDCGFTYHGGKYHYGEDWTWVSADAMIQDIRETPEAFPSEARQRVGRLKPARKAFLPKDGKRVRRRGVTTPLFSG